MGSCTTDISEDVTNARGTTELTAALEGTRTHLGDKDGNTGLYKVYWSNGDCIAVNGRQSDALSNVEEGTASAAFFVNGTVNPPYDVIYPASAYVDGKVVLPAVQNRNGASFAEGAAVLVGRGQTPSVVLKKRMRFRQDPVDEGYRGLRCRGSHPVLRQFARAPVRRVRYRLYRVGTGDPRCGGRGVPPERDTRVRRRDNPRCRCRSVRRGGSGADLRCGFHGRDRRSRRSPHAYEE